MAVFEPDPIPTDGAAGGHDGDGPRQRRQWVADNFAEIFGISPGELSAQGIDPRRYARDHRDRIRRFARMQRSRGMAVPTGREPVGVGPGPGPAGAGARAGPHPGSGPAGGLPAGLRRGGAWIGALVALLALRFVLVDSLVGRHAAVVWVLVIGGTVLVARVLVFSWLRGRRLERRAAGGRSDDPSGS